MKYLLDTNVVSELRKGKRMNAQVRSWYDEVGTEEIWLSVLVVGELRRGIELVRRRDVRQAAALERWLSRLVQEHGERILPVDHAVAEEWGRLSALKSGSLIDGLLAATSRVHSLVLVTRNERHVAWTGATYLNPFRPTRPR